MAASASESASSAKTKSTLMKPFPTVWAPARALCTGLRISVERELTVCGCGSLDMLRTCMIYVMTEGYLDKIGG